MSQDVELFSVGAKIFSKNYRDTERFHLLAGEA